ncbi:MAG: SGNH/GDSL hydrolase family protein [Janthinobacterium lividum]
MRGGRLSRRGMLAGAAALLAGAAAKAGPVAVFGDSQAEGLVGGLRRALRKRPDDGVVLLNRTKPGTAISQPSYDWPAAIAQYVSTEQPCAPVAICLFGGNDRLPVRPAGQPPIPFHSPAWEALYRERLGAMMTTMAKAGMKVVWLGQPVCRDARYSGDMEWLNTLFENTAQAVNTANPALPAVRFEPLWHLAADGAGHFQAYGPGPDGRQERLRLDDGIHFTPAGYELIARHVLDGIEAAA